jgi:hypothetical protein
MLICKCCLSYTSKDTHSFRFPISVRSCIRTLRLFYWHVRWNQGQKNDSAHGMEPQPRRDRLIRLYLSGAEVTMTSITY